MKRALSIFLIALMIATLFTGCTKAKDAAESAVQDAVSQAVSGAENVDEAVESAAQSVADDDTASTFISAYMDAKSEVVNKILDGLTTNPDTVMTAMSFLGISMSDLYILPAMYFGLGETSVSTALAFMGAKDVVYDESGNTYTITYTNSDDQQATMTGTYDSGKSIVCTGTVNGTENVYTEIFRTSFGYVGQFYVIADDGTITVYLIAIDGEDGSVGILTGTDRPASLTGSESADFPKSASEWYAIEGSTITGVDSDGNALSFEYVPSDDND